MTAKPVCNAWNNFWFEQASPAPLCAFRIFFGILTIISILFWAPDLFTLFGSHGLASIQTIQKYEGSNRFSLLFFFPSDVFLVSLYAVMLSAAASFTLGYRTRISTAILAAALISFHHRNPLIMNSGDTLMRITLLLLIASPCGKIFSLDACFNKKQTHPIVSEVWAQRLLQLQLSGVYCQALLSKVVGETWRNGTAVYYTARLEEYAHFPVPILFDHLSTCQLLTWGTLLIEFSLCTLIWSRRFRKYVLLIGVIFHLGIDWSMNIPLFEYIMIAYYLNFLEPAFVMRSIVFVRMRMNNWLKNARSGLRLAKNN